MGSKRSILSKNAKGRLVSELGIDKTVTEKGWGDVSSKDCGSVVKKAIEDVLKDKH